MTAPTANLRHVADARTRPIRREEGTPAFCRDMDATCARCGARMSTDPRHIAEAMSVSDDSSIFLSPRSHPRVGLETVGALLAPDSPILRRDWDAICAELGLSPREIQVGRAILANMPDSRIAATLGISVHTVHTHLERMYRKLKCNNRYQVALVFFAAFVRRANGAPFPAPTSTHLPG